MQSTKEGKIFKTVDKSRERDCETSLEGIGYKMPEFGGHTEIQIKTKIWVKRPCLDFLMKLEEQENRACTIGWPNIMLSIFGFTKRRLIN